MIDNSEHEEILKILEDMDNQELAVQLLKKLNDTSSELGKLILNQDSNLEHDQWKEECDKLKSKLDVIIEEIQTHRK